MGGVPRGRVSEMYGPEGSGKTTVCQHMVAEAQRMGGVATFIDMEHALDPLHAATCGLNVDELYITQPESMLRLGCIEPGAGGSASARRSALVLHQPLLSGIMASP